MWKKHYRLLTLLEAYMVKRGAKECKKRWAGEGVDTCLNRSYEEFMKRSVEEFFAKF